jgi:hypothetical protein
MPLSIEIPDEKTKNLNKEAHKALKSALELLATNVIEEAGRLEAAINTNGNQPQIVSSHIEDAVFLIKKGYIKQRKSRWLKFWQLVAVLSTFISGLIFDYEEVRTNSTLFIAFIILCGFALLSAIIVWNWE